MQRKCSKNREKSVVKCNSDVCMKDVEQVETQNKIAMMVSVEIEIEISLVVRLR